MYKHVEFSGLVPIFSSQAGRCLTAENWQDVGIKVASYSLASLLMKPGLDFLSTLPDLATYVGWPGMIVLNASMPVIDDQGGYSLRSQYDGSRSYYAIDELLGLMAALCPQYVIMPQGVLQYGKNAWQSLPDTIFPFFPISDRPEPSEQRPYGLYFFYDQQTLPFDALKQQLAQCIGLPCYVGGDLSLVMLRELGRCGVQYLESDRPADDACLGTVYTSEGNVSISDGLQALQFEVIDKDCHCPTCSQQFTRAYLHHLLEHTPLLCQRLLVQHNVHFVSLLQG